MIDRRSEIGRALLALRDCRVILVERGYVPAGYQRLQREGAITARPMGNTHAIIRLNEHGESLVGQLKPWNPSYD